MPKKMAVSLCVSYDPQGLIGTMLIELAGDPLTNFELMARWISVLCSLSMSLQMRVLWKKMLVFTPNTSSFSTNLEMSTDMGPVCRHETANAMDLH
jgi:hypothetical protein